MDAVLFHFDDHFRIRNVRAFAALTGGMNLLILLGFPVFCWTLTNWSGI